MITAEALDRARRAGIQPHTREAAVIPFDPLQRQAPNRHKATMAAASALDAIRSSLAKVNELTADRSHWQAGWGRVSEAVMEQKTLYLHSRGQPVRALQLLLKKYEPGLAVDGLFGPRTERAVRAAQRKLEVVPADGIAGPYTLAALTKAAKGSQSANPLPRPKPPDHPSSGSQLSAAVHKAGAAVGSAAYSAEHAVVNTVEQAIAAIEKFIAGLHAKPPQVPANIHPVVQPSRAKAKNEPQPPGEVRDPKTMTMSDKGIKFVFGHEAGAGMAALHLPSSVAASRSVPATTWVSGLRSRSCMTSRASAYLRKPHRWCLARPS